MEKKLSNVFNFVILGNASVAKGFEFNEKFFKVLRTGWFMTYFFFDKKKAQLENKKFFLKPNDEVARAVTILLN